jgi:prephenate dehydrogenase
MGLVSKTGARETGGAGTGGARPDVGIVGAGRFGSYFAAQLGRVGYHVHTADVRSGAAQYDRDLTRVCGSPAVIYAVPIRALERVILETRDRLAPGSVVMDVCSVKMVPCALLERHLPVSAIIGTHPLFGRESAPATCAGQRIAVCLPEGRRGTALGEAAAERADDLFSALGLSIVHCTPDDHDRQIARSQFLTHFIGRGAERCGVERVSLSTKSHDALMDIIDVVCHDSIELFEDMASFNPMTAQVRAQFLAALSEIDGGLRDRRVE